MLTKYLTTYCPPKRIPIPWLVVWAVVVCQWMGGALGGGVHTIKHAAASIFIQVFTSF